MATKEFTAKNHLGQETRHIPRRVTYNGQQGYMWECRTLIQNCWVFSGQSFHPLNATREQISGVKATPKAKEITVNTRLGNGGKWIVIARYTAGPRNLMAASKALAAEKQKNNGVGGYHSNLEIDGNVIGQENIGWDLDTAAAKRIIADPKAYAPYEA